MSHEDVKYKMFRNWMTNELGIGREDIRRWTQEAIEREVQRVVGQINVQATINTAVKGALSEWGSKSLNHSVSQALGAEIAKRLELSVRSTADGGAEHGT